MKNGKEIKGSRIVLKEEQYDGFVIRKVSYRMYKSHNIRIGWVGVVEGRIGRISNTKKEAINKAIKSSTYFRLLNIK
jgi:peptide subunit release factor RF-3